MLSSIVIPEKRLHFISVQGDGSCGGKTCHRNAKCAEIDGVKQCQCKEGFVGSGLICVGTSCIVINMYGTGRSCLKLN